MPQPNTNRAVRAELLPRCAYKGSHQKHAAIESWWLVLHNTFERLHSRRACANPRQSLSGMHRWALEGAKSPATQPPVHQYAVSAVPVRFTSR